MESIYDLNYKNMSDKLDEQLFLAVKHNDTNAVNMLLEAGADINCRDEDGQTPLMIASKNQLYGLVNLLISKGAKLNIKDYIGRTALFIASRDGDIDGVQILLGAGANPNIKNEGGNTALIMASWRHPIECVRILLEAGADPNIKNNNGNTALSIAIDMGRGDNLETIKELLKYGANPNIKNNDGDTALSVAITNEHLDYAVELILAGADISPILLTEAMYYKHKPLLKLLLAYPKIKLNIEDGNGYTPIMIAAKNGFKYGVIELLKDPRININYVSSKYRTLYNSASKEIQDYLDSKGQYRDILRLSPQKIKEKIHNELLAKKLGKGFDIYLKNSEEYLFGKGILKSRKKSRKKSIKKH